MSTSPAMPAWARTSRTAESDLQTGELFGIPIALVILVLVFGALVASVVPIVLALLSIALAVGATAS